MAERSEAVKVLWPWPDPGTRLGPRAFCVTGSGTTLNMALMANSKHIAVQQGQLELAKTQDLLAERRNATS